MENIIMMLSRNPAISSPRCLHHLYQSHCRAVQDITPTVIKPVAMIFTTVCIHFTIFICIETLYEENWLHTTTMLARQSSQPMYDHHRKQVEYCVNNFSPSGTTKDANLPSRFMFPCYSVTCILNCLYHGQCLCVDASTHRHTNTH